MIHNRLSVKRISIKILKDDTEMVSSFCFDDEYKEIENLWVLIQNDDVIMNGMCRKILATKKGYTK